MNNDRVEPEGVEVIEIMGHRDYVGGKWDEIGALQFNYMVSAGLRKDSVFLDIACGSLRGGVHYINYLEKGNYLGIDKEQELIRLGIEHELGKNVEESKCPEFVISDCFEFEKFSKKPDFAIAQSLFTHLTLDDITMCLVNLRKYIGSGKCVFYATFFETEQKRENYQVSNSRLPFYYTFSEIFEIGEKAGWKCEYIGNWNHPRQQQLLKFSV